MELALSLPFDGLPPGWVVLFTIAFLIICGMLAWTAVLFLRAGRWLRELPARPETG